MADSVRKVDVTDEYTWQLARELYVGRGGNHGHLTMTPTIAAEMADECLIMATVFADRYEAAQTARGVERTAQPAPAATPEEKGGSLAESVIQASQEWAARNVLPPPELVPPHEPLMPDPKTATEFTPQPAPGKRKGGGR